MQYHRLPEYANWDAWIVPPIIPDNFPALTARVLNVNAPLAIRQQCTYIHARHRLTQQLIGLSGDTLPVDGSLSDRINKARTCLAAAEICLASLEKLLIPERIPVPLSPLGAACLYSTPATRYHSWEVEALVMRHNVLALHTLIVFLTMRRPTPSTLVDPRGAEANARGGALVGKPARALAEELAVAVGVNGSAPSSAKAVLFSENYYQCISKVIRLACVHWMIVQALMPPTCDAVIRSRVLGLDALVDKDDYTPVHHLRVYVNWAHMAHGIAEQAFATHVRLPAAQGDDRLLVRSSEFAPIIKYLLQCIPLFNALRYTTWAAYTGRQYDARSGNQDEHVQYIVKCHQVLAALLASPAHDLLQNIPNVVAEVKKKAEKIAKEAAAATGDVKTKATSPSTPEMQAVLEMARFPPELQYHDWAWTALSLPCLAEVPRLHVDVILAWARVMNIKLAKDMPMYSSNGKGADLPLPTVPASKHVPYQIPKSILAQVRDIMLMPPPEEDNNNTTATPND